MRPPWLLRPQSMLYTHPQRRTNSCGSLLRSSMLSVILLHVFWQRRIASSSPAVQCGSGLTDLSGEGQIRFGHRVVVEPQYSAHWQMDVRAGVAHLWPLQRRTDPAPNAPLPLASPSPVVASVTVACLGDTVESALEWGHAHPPLQVMWLRLVRQHAASSSSFMRTMWWCATGTPNTTACPPRLMQNEGQLHAWCRPHHSWQA